MRHLFLLFLLFLFNWTFSFSSMMLFFLQHFLFCPSFLSLLSLFFPTPPLYPLISFIFSFIPTLILFALTHSEPTKSSSLVVPVNGHVDLKTNLTPPLITHTAATPMPIPKLPVGGDPVLGYESRRGSNVSIDPACYDKSPVCIFIFTHTKSLCQLSSVITLFRDFRKSPLIYL